MDPHLSAALAWYTRLASDPCWKSYAWQQANDLAQQHPCVFRDLPELLKAEMLRRKGLPSEAAHSS
jgi:hypothetical protein